MLGLPHKALSIMQPWAWLIVTGYKCVENRDWGTRFRGPFAIHAGKKVDASAWADVQAGVHPVTGEFVGFSEPIAPGGGIVGIAEIVDCVDYFDNPWFVGKFGFIIRNARPVDFIPCRGELGFFDWRKKEDP